MNTLEKRNKFIKIVIFLILSGININLAVSLELWTKSAGRAAVAVFMAAGFVLGYVLVSSFSKRQEGRLKRHSFLWALPMAASYVLGCRMRRDGTALSGAGELPLLLLEILLLAVPAAGAVAAVLAGGSGRRKMQAAAGPGQVCEAGSVRGEEHHAEKRRKEIRVWLVSAAVIFFCWLPVFLAYYPSVFAYDAEGQLYQVIAHDYSTHHPLLHTLFLGAFFRLGGGLFDSYQTGMAVHSLVQMALMAAAFGYTLAFLYRKGVRSGLRTALLLFYGLFPVNSVLAVSTTKDVLFSALVLLYTIYVFQMADQRESDRDSANDLRISGGRNPVEGLRFWVLYVFWTGLMLLFRNNAVYAFVLTVPFLCTGLYRMKKLNAGLWKKCLLFSLTALVLAGAGNAVLKAATGAQNGSPREMLSVPLQQMARTRVKEEETIPSELRQELERYLPSEWVFAAYNPYLADPVKNRAVIHDDPAGLIRTWVKLGLKYPQTYIDAFLDNSVGYWFLEDRTHARIYGIGTESGFGYLSTDNRTMPAGCEILPYSFLPGFRAGMERIVSDNVYEKLPVIRLLFAPAFYWWMLCLYMAAVIYRRQYRLLLPAVFPVIYYMTLLLSPTVLIRYMYPFVVTVPTICCLYFGLYHAYGGEKGSISVL